MNFWKIKTYTRLPMKIPRFVNRLHRHRTRFWGMWVDSYLRAFLPAKVLVYTHWIRLYIYTLHSLTMTHRRLVNLFYSNTIIKALDNVTTVKETFACHPEQHQTKTFTLVLKHISAKKKKIYEQKIFRINCYLIYYFWDEHWKQHQRCVPRATSILAERL